jgi:cob(I)alamin adenosyltransferase
MKIYTRRGDGGETDLFGGVRVGKDAPRVEAYGDVDELNSVLGSALAQSKQGELLELGRKIQAELFEIGAYLATPSPGLAATGPDRAEKNPPLRISDDEIAFLETKIDALSKELPPLRRFVLPGGTPPAAAFHLARTVCRRAERRAIALHREEPLDEAVVRYLNRLSDLLFVLARVENRRAGVDDVEWVPPGR